MNGQTITHYRILHKLGRGGMAEVYEAEDIRLGRHVALKFLPDGMAGDTAALDRFQLEARATSSLNHPGICTIFDIASHDGLPFIVMELLEGESLKDRLQHGPMPVDQVIDTGIQLADALEAAHRSGIIHRDVKPGNIFLTRFGQAKVLDFGLAKLASEPRSAELKPLAAGGERHRTSEALTNTSAIPGTTLYMSPEQARGQLLDERTDLFSLGVVLYEAASGHKPFEGRNSVATMEAIQHQRPTSPSNYNPQIPPGLEQILGGLLEKDRRLRYQSARELAEDLRRLKRQLDQSRAPDDSDNPLIVQPSGTFRKFSVRQMYVLLGAAGAIAAILLAVTIWWARHGTTAASVTATNNSVVVLPFQNVNNDPDTDYLRVALADELVKILAYTRSLEIRPVPSGKYASGAIDPQQAGKDLKAAYVITGHFVSQSDRLTVTINAIEVRHNRLTWQGSFTVPQQNLISLQEDMAANVKSGLLPALGTEAAMLSTATQPHNPDAYDLYLRGAALPHDADPNSTAIVMLEHAVQLDPKFAPAWDALGLRYYYDASYAGAGVETLDKSVAAYEKALSLDPNLISSAAHLTRIHAERGQMSDAYGEARDLVSRRPENAQAHFTMAYVLRYAGMLQDAVRECDAALALDPGNYDFRSCSFAFFELGRMNRAEEYVKLDEGTEWASSVWPAILLRENKVDEARTAAAKVSDSATWFKPLLQACVKPVPAAEMRRLAERARPQLLGLRDPEFRYYQAAIMSYCGQQELAAEMIQSSIAQHYCAHSALYSDPLLAKLRATTYFPTLVEQAKQCQYSVFSGGR